MPHHPHPHHAKQTDQPAPDPQVSEGQAEASTEPTPDAPETPVAVIAPPRVEVHSGASHFFIQYGSDPEDPTTGSWRVNQTSNEESGLLLPDEHDTLASALGSVADLLAATPNSSPTLVGDPPEPKYVDPRFIDAQGHRAEGTHVDDTGRTLDDSGRDSSGRLVETDDTPVIHTRDASGTVGPAVPVEDENRDD
jgi:hypothetical protein